MSKLLIPGGSGFLGMQLARHFSQKGWEVCVLSRSKKANKEGVCFVQWDGKSLGDWCKQLDTTQVVVNMAGRSVNCRYNEKNKKEILDSRVQSTRILGQAIAQAAQLPTVWINSSSATIYEDTRSDMPSNDEYEGKLGNDFSPSICKAWENEFFGASVAGVRQVAMRTAIVIGKEPGGALEYLINLTKLWLGGTQGSGDQYISWVHLHDFTRMVEFLIEKQTIKGLVNCAAPYPISNKEFMAKLRKAVGRSWGLPMPRFLLEIGTFMLRTQTELVLKSRKVVSKRMEEEGFIFDFDTVEKAFKEICPVRR